MEIIKIHKILSHGDFTAARRHTLNFFSESMLLNYERVEVDKDESCDAVNPHFWRELERGIERNNKLVEDCLRELEDMNCSRIADLGNLPTGYPSKVLHILAHLMDGFIGIDSVFYNLPEDSHWLTGNLRTKIKTNPASYCLLHVRAYFSSLQDAVLVHK